MDSSPILRCALLTVVAVAGCAPAPDTAPPAGGQAQPVAQPAAQPQAAAQGPLRNCIDTLTANREFSRFVNGVVNTHVVQDFRQARDITIFAPTNAGLQRMNAAVVDRLFPRDEAGGRQADPVLAPAAVGAHVVQGRHSAAELASGQQFTSVAGTPLSTSGSGGTVTVSGAGGTQARVTRADIACSNGVVHGIDAPLIR